MRIPSLAAFLFLASGSLLLAAVSTPLEIRQDEATLNFQAVRGVPLSSTVGDPVGSDGRAPTQAQQIADNLTVAIPTAGQFRGLSLLGATAGLRQADWQTVSNSLILKAGTTALNATVASEMKLPVATSNNVVVLILRRTSLGAPFHSRQVSSLFGSILEVPTTDENGNTLTNILKEAYWLAQPHTTNNHSNAGYYWSPHAGAVYAAQAGPLTVTWMKATPYNTANVPTYTNPNGSPSFVTNGGSVFLLYSSRHVVSGGAVKPPRKIYWTEGALRPTGKPVAVPKTRVPGGVKIVYSTGFPRTVATEYVAPGQSGINEGTTNQVLVNLRTLYYDDTDGFLHAYNAEGRVFMELLGDARPDGQTFEPLGFEIVDVIKQPTPADVTTELGERLDPPAPGSIDTLEPEEVVQGLQGSFVFRHVLQGSDRASLYANRRTLNENDCLIHWMESGLQGLKWPSLFARYHLVWPEDPARFSHYIRPAVASESEAKSTAVSIDAQTVPMIVYQDPLDTPRAKLTEEGKFYTFLDAAHPAHRALLRFTAGQQIAYERVFSWLNTNLVSTNFANTVAAELPPIANALNYPAALVSYNQYLADLTAYSTYTNLAATLRSGANGDWKLYVTDDSDGDNGALTSWSLQIVTYNTNTTALTTNVFTSGSSLTIPLVGYASTYPSTIAVSGLSDFISDLRVSLNGISHIWPDDLDIFLVGPRSDVCALMSDAGGGADLSSHNLVFSDSATQSVPNESAISSATYKPTDYVTGESLPPGGTGSIGTSLQALLLPSSLPARTAPQIVQSPDPGGWPDELAAPRVVHATINVGDRIQPPAGELGSASPYVAGYLNTAIGTSYNPTAYLDPFTVGLTAASAGAIIPVNVLPGKNQLEVWWFRTNSSNAGLNAGNTQRGFKTIYWPSLIGRYTIQWPANPREIVLASNAGAGTLDSAETQGVIYHQNDPTLHGYNPNEEHAVMAGGTAYATRDDLNITSGDGYSSDRYVLISYLANDSRPSMSVFRVLREKPAGGLVFDYIVPAGRIVQAPMPLPLLAKPVLGSGDAAINFNTEPSHSGGDLPTGWTTDASTNRFGHYARFTWSDRHHDTWVYRGLHSGLPSLAAGSYNTNTATFDALPNATAIVGSLFTYTVHASRQDEYLSLTAPIGLPAWLSIQGLRLSGTPDGSAVGTTTLSLVVTDLYDGVSVTNSLELTVAASGSPVALAPLALISSNAYTRSVVIFSNRPPFLAQSPAPSNSFTLRYYYKTEPSFAWPGLTPAPAAGSIVPYLRPVDPDTGAFVGNAATNTTASLEIVYRPVWPVRDPKDASKPVPTLPYGLTLVTPRLGLPGVKDFKTAHILYQQSIAGNLPTAPASAVLHDPTRAKSADLTAFELAKLPSGVVATPYQGRYYFPNLPPHLGTRVYYDPNLGAKGSLVLKGEFKQETLGESYIQLNVLRGTDLAAVLDLCPSADTEFSKWTNLVAGLATAVEIFHENPERPGTYIANPDRTQITSVQNLAEVLNDNTPVDSYALSATGPGTGYITLVEASGSALTEPGDPVSMHIFKVGGTLYPGELKILASPNPLSELVTFQHTADLAGRFAEYEYEWKIAPPTDGAPPLTDATMSRYLALTSGPDIPRYTLGGAGIQALGDNYVVMRYRATTASHPRFNQWSDWTTPKLAEGWIKRVLAGINPFNQRVSDLFNNRVNTDVSILTQAGHRWEGDIALNADTINNYGLIEIYETVLRRGRMLSIESGYNYGPANDALLLAAGYLSDLYMMSGNEAWADASNPTIGIGTKDRDYGDIATALFAFRGQLPSLLEEELALLRGRDDFMQPGVEVTPIYNRLVWNYTRGIDAGEVIYALNYNIQEDSSRDPDGVINAEDAAIMFPQGHGDAVGHYLTALKGYYSLLLNAYFDWVPRTEAVNVLGQPVQVDYQDERKFAAAAVAVARSLRQVFDLTWRKDFASVRSEGWAHFAATRSNTQRDVPTTRYWGLDHWATRGGQSAFLNWTVGNALLPAVDPNPAHEGIQKVDRTTVPELRELATLVSGLQTALDNAEGGLSPLGLPEGGLAFDINPNAVVGSDQGTHFEQIYQRAKAALNNAVASFDDAKDVTRLMRSEQDSLADVRAEIVRQEAAFNNALIAVYGTPYPEDMGPGKTYKQDYDGPDLYHYSYIDRPELIFDVLGFKDPVEFNVDVNEFPDGDVDGVLAWEENSFESLDSLLKAFDFIDTSKRIPISLDPDGFFGKPEAWTGARRSPGKVQQVISDYAKAHFNLVRSLDDADFDIRLLNRELKLLKKDIATRDDVREEEDTMLFLQYANSVAEAVKNMAFTISDATEETISYTAEGVTEALPKSVILGLANGGDVASPARAALIAAKGATSTAVEWGKVITEGIYNVSKLAADFSSIFAPFYDIEPLQWEQEMRGRVNDLAVRFDFLSDRMFAVTRMMRAFDDAKRNYQAALAEGDRILAERETYRRRAAALVQGYRTRDAAFRVFRNEKLERYKTLFDLAARYTLLAANAYDYETGLLNTSQGRDFVHRIVNSRALGVVRNGEPQYAGSNTGDPGLSSVLAEMKADWDVLRGRLGFNNPDAYGTTVSLRTECLRILPGTDGDAAWTDTLHQASLKDILTDSDVRQHCLQVGSGQGLPVPGIVLSFETTITGGQNLFGRQLAAGDHAFSASSYATKIFGVGVALDGYRGMDNPSANSGTVGGAGGTSPTDPGSWYLDPLALAATPYVYLIPVGQDIMRSPPLGDASALRAWNVEDVAIPMPFNIGASDFSTKQLWQSGDSLTEPLFATRKHQAFRPVANASFFSPSLYGHTGSLQRSQFTNNRLVGRSVWNTRWKLVIPGTTLLNDPKEGLDRFIQTVKDVKLHFVTYSYAGN